MSENDIKRVAFALALDEFADSSIEETCCLALATNLLPICVNVETAAGVVIHNRPQNVRIEDYTELVIPQYTDDTFKSHFRMRRSSFEVNIVAGYLYHQQSYLSQLYYDADQVK